MSLYLRKANERDDKRLFAWANEEETRANSFHTEEISWEEHSAWMENILKAEDVLLYIAMDFMKPVGQARLNLGGDVGRISYSIDKECRGNHYGQKMLSLLEEEAAGKVKRLVAEVKPGNAASGRIFEKLGYGMIQEEADRIVYEKDISRTEPQVIPAAAGSMFSPKRETTFEILRIVAMLMVIMLHYLSKGRLLADPASGISLSGWLFWTLEALCLVCVNVYVLISGYFCVENKFRLSKIAALWCQVFFYSVVTAAVCMIAGIADFRQYLNLFDLQFFVFPVINGHYWFASAYLIMYLFSPILNHAVKAMSKKQMQIVILMLLIPFCFAKSILPVPLKSDDLGNSFVWFLCLYLIAAYIRLHGIAFFEKKGRPLAIYLLSAAGILFTLAMGAALVNQTGSYGYILEIPQHYNFIFVLTGSLGLFYCFKTWKIKENPLTDYLARIAPYTFGVYLLHENLLLRYWWPEKLRVSASYGVVRPVHMILTVLVIFSAGIIIDALRSLLFRWIDKLIVIALRIYYAKREAMDYLIFGFLATVVNWIAYISCAYCFLMPALGNYDTARAMAANVIAWVTAVVFAYWTNRTFVFRSQVQGGIALVREFLAFVSARVISFLVETLLLFIMVDWLKINDIISKAFISVVVIVLNYIFSKLWIFKDKKE